MEGFTLQSEDGTTDVIKIFLGQVIYKGINSEASLVSWRDNSKVAQIRQNGIRYNIPTDSQVML